MSTFNPNVGLFDPTTLETVDAETIRETVWTKAYYVTSPEGELQHWGQRDQNIRVVEHRTEDGSLVYTADEWMGEYPPENYSNEMLVDDEGLFHFGPDTDDPEWVN